MPSPSSKPTDYVYVPLHVELYADLVRRSGKADVASYIEHSVESFLLDTEGDPVVWSTEYIEKLAEEEDAAFLERYGDPGRGYQWGTLFLPNGTQVRMSYGGKDSYAEVCHTALRYNEESMSPSQLASRIANNTSRNAWRDLFVKFPGQGSWLLADDLRRRKSAPSLSAS